MTITNILVGITVLISYMAFTNRQLFHQLLHSPYVEKRDKDYYRLISSGFVHADYMHLGLNMYVFWSFGNNVELYFKYFMGPVTGGLLFLALYLGAIVFGDLPSYFKHQNHSHYTAVGASGGVAGIMLASVVFQPWGTIALYGFIELPAIVAAVMYLFYSAYAAKQNKDNIGHDAHLYGAIFGFVFTLLVNPLFIKIFITEFTKGLPF